MRCLRSIILILILAAGCVDPYYPKLNKEDLNALVVDGFIDQDGSASVSLSRSIEVDVNSDATPEHGAVVIIKSSDGSEFDLVEENAGTYSASNLEVGMDSKYTLYIKTLDGDEYQSDQMQIYPTPPIDSIYFTVAPSGDHVDINISTRDNYAGTGYYLWNGFETYQYHAFTYSGYKFIDHLAIERTPEEQIYTCWRTLPITPVMGSTHNLSRNVINAQRVQSIDKSSVKFQVRYSILVQQRVISEEEYDFRVQLQKSTELQGSLFSTIPGAVVSNVHSINNRGEYVLGYFRGQQTQRRRLFIDQSELPGDFRVSQPYPNCQQEKTCEIGQIACSDGVPIFVLGNETIITSGISDASGNVVAYYFVASDCGDCRAKGGVTRKPDFW
jgi:hypothetical protein